jgi:hypothetical protein
MTAPNAPQDLHWAALEAERLSAGDRQETLRARHHELLVFYQQGLHRLQAAAADSAALPRAQATYRALLTDLRKLEAEVREAEVAYLAICHQMQSFHDWQIRSDALVRDLKAEYQGHGPQYEILIRRLVQAEMHAQQLETTGRIGSAEHQRATKGVLQLVQALQKYTEENATVRKAINEAVLQALAILEPEIRAVAPQAWTAGVQKLRARLMGPEAA